MERETEREREGEGWRKLGEGGRGNSGAGMRRGELEENRTG